MQVVWRIASAYALAILLANLGLYAWRRRLLARAAQSNLLEPLGLMKAVIAFVKECAAMAVILPCVPLGWLMRPCRGGPGRRGPLVLLHGWGVNRGALRVLRRRLLRDGWSPVHCFEPPTRSTDIIAAAGALRTVVDRLSAQSPDAPRLALVGHGIGGLVLRYYLRRYPAPRVRRAVTLGTPHHGTAVARLLGSRGTALLPGSPLLRQLQAADRVPQQFDLIAMHSSFDASVLPLEYALYPGAFNIQFDDVGHYALLFSRKVYQVLTENLAAPPA